MLASPHEHMEAAIEYISCYYSLMFEPAKGGPESIDNTRNTPVY